MRCPADGRADGDAGRAGVSLLSAAGLPGLIAGAPAWYVELAAALAGDTVRLAAGRRGLWQRVAASPLANAGRVSRALTPE